MPFRSDKYRDIFTIRINVFYWIPGTMMICIMRLKNFNLIWIQEKKVIVYSQTIVLI